MRKLLDWIKSWRASRDDDDEESHEPLPQLVTVPEEDGEAQSPTASAGETPARAAAVLRTIDDVLELKPPFKRLRMDWTGTDAAATACIAELEDGQYVVFVKRGYDWTDIYRAVYQRAREESDDKPVPTYIVEPVVLVTLVGEGVEADELRVRRSLAGSRSAMRTGFHDLADWAIRHGASDLHLHIDKTSPTSKVGVTIDGVYLLPSSQAMPTDRMIAMAQVAYFDVRGGNGTAFDHEVEQQGRLYEVIGDKTYLLRWGSFVADTGPSITLRIQDLSNVVQAQSLSTLGFLPSQAAQLERALMSEGGGVIIGGIPGSGKTTTLTQLIAGLPPGRKINTIEDPVEMRIPNALQASITRSPDGQGDDQNFLTKLMALKRAAVNDVLLGEIRDRLSGSAFQDMVQAGANGYSTTHVMSALGIPQRLASEQIGIPRDVLAEPRFLKLLGYQSLLPALCPHCALPAESLLEGGQDALGRDQNKSYWLSYLGRIESLYDISSASIKVRNPQGCPHCQQRGLPQLYGYQGRTVCAELFEPSFNPEALRAIAKGDALRLHEIYASARTSAFSDPDMTGKSAMECAVYKMSQGMLDPRSIEPRFMAFETVESIRLGHRQIKESA